MSPSPLTTSNSQPQSGSSGGDFSPSRMAGARSGGDDGSDGDEQGSPTGAGGTPDPSSNPSPSMGQVTGTIRQMEQSLLSLSSQYPAASQDIRRAIEGVRNVLKRIISNPGVQEPASPRSS